MRLGTLLALAGLITVLAVAVAAENTSGEQTKAKALFEQRCSMCHGFERALAKNKTKDAWQATVERMKTHSQRLDPQKRITDEDVAAIVDYLAVVRGPK